MSCIQSTLAKAGNVGQYLVGGLGPDKRFGIFVGDVQIAVDGSLQFGAAPMHAAAQLLFGEQTEPALHQVQPGGAGGCEVHMEAGPLGQPVADQRRLVGGVVVRDQVDVEVGRLAGTSASMVSRNLRNSTARCRWWQRPITLPVLVSKAANSEVVP